MTDGTEGTALKKQAILDMIVEVGRIKPACRKAKLPFRTYYNWRRDDPEFKTASDVARSIGMEALLDDSEDYLVTHESPVSRMFMLKSHRRPIYGDKQETTLTGENGGPLVIHFSQRSDGPA